MAIILAAFTYNILTSNDFRTIIVNGTEPIKGVVFHLDIDERVMGLPRLLFVLTLGCVGVLIVGCIAMLITCYQQRKKDRNYYSFSLLSEKPERKKLFEDDDDVDETELFRTPIKSMIFLSFLI